MKILVRERIADAGIDFLRRRFEVDVDFDSPARGEDRRLRRDHRSKCHRRVRGADRPGRAAEGDRPRRCRGRQRRRGGGLASRDRRRERASVDHRLGSGARLRAPAGALPEHPAGARSPEGGPLGASALRRTRAGGQNTRGRRLRPDRAAGRAPGPRLRDGRPGTTTPTWPRSGSGISARRWWRASRSSCPNRTS